VREREGGRERVKEREREGERERIFHFLWLRVFSNSLNFRVCSVGQADPVS
jgi:hypothetical protein